MMCLENRSITNDISSDPTAPGFAFLVPSLGLIQIPWSDVMNNVYYNLSYLEIESMCVVFIDISMYQRALQTI